MNQKDAWKWERDFLKDAPGPKCSHCGGHLKEDSAGILYCPYCYVGE